MPRDDTAIRAIAHLIAALEAKLPLVTFEDVLEAARLHNLPAEADELRALLDQAVRQLVVFRDTRTRFDPAARRFWETQVYRINPRHPLASALRE